MGAPSYPTNAGDTLGTVAPTPTYGDGAVSDRINCDQAAVGSPLACHQDSFVVDAVAGASKIAYWRAPFACRIREIGLISSTDSAAATADVTITGQVGAVDILAATTFDAGPKLSADTLYPVNSASTPALTNYTNIVEDAVLKFTLAFGGTWGANSTVQIVVTYEPQLQDETVSAQYNRSYRPVLREKDS